MQSYETIIRRLYKNVSDIFKNVKNPRWNGKIFEAAVCLAIYFGGNAVVVLFK